MFLTRFGIGDLSQNFGYLKKFQEKSKKYILDVFRHVESKSDIRILRKKIVEEIPKLSFDCPQLYLECHTISMYSRYKFSQCECK